MTTYTVEIVVNGRDNASGPLGRVGGALGNIGQIAAGILGADLFKGMLSGLSNLGQEALQSYASFERLGMALQSLSARELLNTGQATSMAQAMSMAKGQAEGLQGWIEKLAIQSPFNQDDVAQSFRLAMAYGFTSDQAKRLTQATIDFAAGSGASGQSMQQIALALGQIQAKGKLAGQEMLQLTNAGLDVRGILADAFGVTTEQLIRMQERGLIPANEAIEAIVSSLENDFGGAAKAQAGTFSGLLSSLEDIKSVGLRQFFEGTFKTIQPYVQQFVDTLTSPEFMAGLSAAGERVGQFVGGAIIGFKNLGQLFGYIQKEGLDAFNPLALQNFLGLSKETSQAVYDIFDAVRNSAAVGNITQGFQNLVVFWQRNGPGIIAIVQDVFGRIGEILGPALGQVITFATAQFEKITAWLVENGPLIQSFLSMIGEQFIIFAQVAASSLQWILPLLDGLISYLLNLGTLIMQLATGDWAGAWQTMQNIVAQNIQTVQTVVWGFLNWVTGMFGSSAQEFVTVWGNNWAMLQIVAAREWARFTTWMSGIWTTLTQLFAIGMVLLQNWQPVLLGTVNIILTTLGTVISTAITAIVTAVLALVSQFVAAGMQLVQGIATGAQDALSSLSSTFLGIGASIVDGVKQGIENKWDALVAWFEGLLADLAAAAEAVLNINSPSKVFAAIGKQTMAGLAVGIEKNSRAPQSAVVDATSNITGVGRRQANRVGKSVMSTQNQANYFGPVTFVTQGTSTQDNLRTMR